MRLLAPVTLAASMLLAPGARAQAPRALRLRMRFQPRAVTRYAGRSVQLGTARGQRTRTEAQVQFTLTTHAVDASGDATRSLRVTRASLRGDPMSFNDRVRLAHAIERRTLRFRESPRGEVRERSLDAADDPVHEGLAETLLRGFDTLRPVLPEGEVRVGARWSTERQATLGATPGMSVTVRYHMDFSLSSVRPDGAAVISLRLQLRAPEGSTLAGVPMRGEGEGTGEAVFDVNRGLLLGSTLRGSFTARLTVRGRELVMPSRFEDELRLVARRAPDT